MTENTRLKEKSLPLPITQKARQIAQQLAAQLHQLPSTEQVYLNALAVLVVNDYLQMMDVDTDLESSESFNPLLRLAADVSDLNIIGLGQLECRAVSDNQRICHIPQDVWEDRIGYAIVQINESQRLGTILGFIPSVTTTEFPINQLQPLEALLHHLDELQQPAVVNVPVFLSQWLEDLFTAGWQNLEMLLGDKSSNLALSLRSLRDRPESGVIGAKLVDLGVKCGRTSIILIVKLIPQGNGQMKIRVQAHPAPGESCLPTNLLLAVRSETGEILREVRSRSLDNYLQLPQFQGQQGESFQLQLSLNQSSFIENLLI